jgi:hypothetical protein
VEDDSEQSTENANRFQLIMSRISPSHTQSITSLLSPHGFSYQITFKILLGRLLLCILKVYFFFGDILGPRPGMLPFRD